MADDEFKTKKERDPIMMVCFVVFLLAVCAITGGTVYNNYLKADNTIAVTGNNVSVDYIGTYYAPFGEENSVVFDTSYWSIANDTNVPKGNDFVLRSQSSYEPLSFAVGGTTVLAGFGNAVIGHKVGDVIQVKLDVGQGYTAASTETEISASTVITVDRSETLTASQFESIYGFTLKGFKEIEKSVYGWPATASFNSSSNTVTISYHPTNGASYNMVDNDFGKVDLKVTSVTATTISYTYQVSEFVPVNDTGGASKEIQIIKMDLGTKKLYITSVVDADGNGVAESFTYKTTGERFDQVLYFEIKIVSIG